MSPDPQVGPPSPTWSTFLGSRDSVRRYPPSFVKPRNRPSSPVCRSTGVCRNDSFQTVSIEKHQQNSIGNFIPFDSSSTDNSDFHCFPFHVQVTTKSFSSSSHFHLPFPSSFVRFSYRRVLLIPPLGLFVFVISLLRSSVQG